MSEEKRFIRSRTDRMLGGVCAGIAHYMGIDPILIRIAFFALALVNGIGLILYFVLWVIVPDDQSRNLSSEEAVRSNMNDIGQQFRSITQNIGSTRGPMIAGLFLIFLGVWFMLKMAFPQLDLDFGIFWPILLIGLGLFFLFRRR